jgi:uncharacterized damage-inducible protein DinB
MKIKNDLLIKELIESVQNINSEVEVFLTLTKSQLNQKSNPDAWSILECIEHLNLYNDFYIPEITKQASKAEKVENGLFKSGVIGNYFAKSMLPKDKFKKMKTFDDKNPIGSDLTEEVIHKFLKYGQELISLLENSKQVNLTKTKTAITISKVIKLRLGDTYRFLINHQIRHLAQAKRCL